MRIEPETGVAISSSEEERDDKLRRGRGRFSFQTPPTYKTLSNQPRTPSTVTPLTPSPLGSSVDIMSPSPEPMQTRGFLAAQQGFLDHPTALFRNPRQSRTRRKRQSSAGKSRLSQSLLLDGYDRKLGAKAFNNVRKLNSFGSISYPADSSSPETSPDGSPARSFLHSRNSSLPNMDIGSSASPKFRSKSILYIWGFLALAMASSLGMILLTRSAVTMDKAYEITRPLATTSAAGLRGQMTSGHWSGKRLMEEQQPHVEKNEKSQKKAHVEKKESHAKTDAHHHSTEKKAKSDKPHSKTKEEKKHHETDHHKLPKQEKAKSSHHKTHEVSKSSTRKRTPIVPFKVHLPPPITSLSSGSLSKFDSQDHHMYEHGEMPSVSRRVFILDPSTKDITVGPARSIETYPSDFTDNTQFYSILDSSDERLSHMEIREPYSQGECVPMQDWQTTYHPSCNGMHEIGMEYMGKRDGNDVQLFGTKGFWRYAWRLDVPNIHEKDTMVLKTLKYEHNFEDAHFEHDRVDAVAMERLTSSPHVIDVFGFCGHSVITEYADGPRLGALADKAKKIPLARLQIASDIAHGMADVHGIDGDGNATFVHLDVNPANVISVGGTLKLNDFNIGIIRRWNTTSQEPCGFPAQYPNPQWRSPEEARNEQNLTEKVDIFSMGHIFFRLICGHEPWNKLEPGGKPPKEVINERVQKGILPTIPEEVLNSKDPEVVAIREAMLSCYTYDPKNRPSARSVANALDKALKALQNQDQ